MNIKIKLETVIDAIEATDDAYTYFYDTQTSQIVYISDYYLTWEKNEELEQLIDNNPERFMRFPTKYEIHEYNIIESFILSRPYTSLKDHLLSAIKGKGAFRRFKDLIIQYGIEQEWYSYQKTAYHNIAIRWCEDNKIDYEE